MHRHCRDLESLFSSMEVPKRSDNAQSGFSAAVGRRWRSVEETSRRADERQVDGRGKNDVRQVLHGVTSTSRWDTLRGILGYSCNRSRASLIIVCVYVIMQCR